MTRSDPSTGVLDRYGCLELVTKLAAWAEGSHKPLVALWIDLDRFRQINESFGHLGGDNMIVQIAERLKSRLYGRAELARMGGDEFVCLAPNLDRHHAEDLAREVLQVIELPLRLGEILLHPSASIGIAILESGEDPFVFLERTDQAMIAAKRQGGNRYVFSGDEPMPGRLGILLAREELDIENKLHTALETGGLRLHYQPILGFDGRIEAIEALMRCTVDGEQIPPAKFIPVAEKTGLVIRIGEWSLLQGAQYARQLQDAGLRTKVAINVSRAQLLAPKFAQALHGALLCADVTPELIELELTESLFMDISDAVQNNLRSARECGVGLAIDDFGTGYSCLANLKDIPATKLKLDRAFVQVLPEDRRALAVIRAMTQLGRELGMTIVAEGVENREQLEALEEAGVDAVQGYYHARPMDEDALHIWLQERKLP
ncbi:putative bifunctional diguanylate cyclase/phosphodiesterase [Denitratisoma oestradiolicum]|nr:EAL domain-containing protein [Denitratisoma oestradiolicum]TWO79452.1 GGDEF-domain containing protein [Denitratisoma oestradiolicum]